MFKKILRPVFLGIGSNLGDREGNLRLALSRIREGFECGVLESSVYETEPWGFDSNSHFLNMAVKIETSVEPWSLFSIINSIEKSMGRVRVANQYSSRIIDIDILFYDDIIVNKCDLKIPHPLLHERRFVLEPLSEIAPDFIHPVFGQTVKSLLGSCIDKGGIRKQLIRLEPEFPL